MDKMVKLFSKVNIKQQVSSKVGKLSFSVVTSIVAGTCLATVSSIFSPASAFTFTNTGQTAGNPTGQALNNVGITTADIGDTFEVDWLLPKATKNTDGKSATVDLSATGLFKVVSLTQNLLSLQVKITNATDASFQAAITSMGFGVTPDATSVSFAPNSSGSVFKTAEKQTGQQQFAGGFKNIDACIYTSNGCSGGTIKDGLQSGGKSDTYTVNIAGNFGMNYSSATATVSSLPLKFQTSAGSFELAGTGRRRKVPEPGTTAALGVVALCAIALRKAKHLSSKEA